MLIGHVETSSTGHRTKLDFKKNLQYRIKFSCFHVTLLLPSTYIDLYNVTVTSVFWKWYTFIFIFYLQSWTPTPLRKHASVWRCWYHLHLLLHSSFRIFVEKNQVITVSCKSKLFSIMELWPLCSELAKLENLFAILDRA